MQTSFLRKVGVASVMSLMLGGVPASAADAYNPNHIYQLRPTEKDEIVVPCIGATGIQARVHRGLVVKVESLMKDSPASGKFTKDEILTGVNGVALEGQNLFVVFGKALTAAEASDGKLLFDVLSPDGKTARQQLVEIPVLGAYSETWPLNCPKSEKIVREAAEFFSQPQWLKDKGIPGALTCLFLLSTGDDPYLPAVKSYFDSFPEEMESIGGHTWNNGYNGIACAEYYLRSGDKSVLPILQFYCDDAKRRQKFGVGWIHWGDTVNPGYVAGGLMNPAGAQILTTLLLAKECGLDVDEETLLGSLRYFYRFAGKGTVPYGDHRGEGALGSNGKDGMIAAAMQIACGSSGDTTIYQKARDHLALSMMDSYPGLSVGHGDKGRGDAIWRCLVTPYLQDLKPQPYRTAMERLKWWHDLGRLPNGATQFPTVQWECGVVGSSGAGVGLSYTAPRKALRITGAPRTKFSKDYELPARLWGTEADLAFHSIDHHPTYYDHGGDEPVHVPFWKFGNAYTTPQWNPEVQTRESMLKNVYHSNYMIRAQAAKAMKAMDMMDELETLLGDPDPRIRRAAIDGLGGYNYWFGMGKGSVSSEQFTPGMLKALQGMLANPQESWWVIDGVLWLMKQAPNQAIVEALPLIQAWTQHDDWWLREAAFTAMSGLADDPAAYRKVLPQMLDLLAGEYHTMPRQRMLNHFKEVLRKTGDASELGGIIIAGLKDSVRKSEIKDGLRTREGATNVMESAKACLQHEPQTAVAVAEMIRDRMASFDTGSLITLVASPNAGENPPKSGLYPALDTLKGDDREALIDLLHGVYRKEFIKRLKQQEGPLDQALVDTLIDLTQLRGDINGWQPLGKLAPSERTWRFMTFDPQRKEDEKEPRERTRFRRVQLPSELKGWHEVAYDDQAWRSGKAPIGKGDAEYQGVRIPNASEWGKGEFIVMRTTFEVGDLDYDAYRLRILASQGYDVYLNGKRIESYVWWQNLPAYRPFAMAPGTAALLKKGSNVLAAYSNMEYHKKTREETAQMDLYIEGLKLSEIVKD